MFAFAKQLVRSAEGIISNSDDSYHDSGANSGYGNAGNNPPAYGFRVVHVDQNSAAREAGIESLFDFIIGLNGHDLVFPQPDYSSDAGQQYHPHHQRQGSNQHVTVTAETAPIDTFLQEIANCRGRSVSFEVWSAKGRVQRTVQLAVPEAEKSLIESGGDDTSSTTGPAASGRASGHYQGHDRNMSSQSNYSASDSGTTYDDFGLGLTVQWTPLEVADHVWHVLNVSPNSPAERAGLISHADYIVAAEKGLLESGGESLLARVVSRMVSGYYNQYPQEQDLGNAPPPPEIELYVYNHDYDTVRPVRIQPNPNWGGSGLLGCGVGYGLLHRLPVVVGKFSASGAGRGRSVSRSSNNLYTPGVAPGDTLFEASHEDEPVSPLPEQSSVYSDNNDTSNFITPASLANAAPHISAHPPPPPRSTANKTRRHHAHSVTHANQAGADLSSYFAEEEQRSREVEGTRAINPSSTLPPPPPPSKK
ncbi:Grh1p [Sugiyamaella lignohabitans]|uniref:Grh1p n=1 Tax=Sugiyamaella lignohabitans TaxID=796027 RepID=A0A161HMR2_9ASCO|nr:Grh1p [Sugiyamaella lignohabitans]ANB15167.1 Grh1p [Sugiyamaella lignohabitans]